MDFSSTKLYIRIENLDQEEFVERIGEKMAIGDFKGTEYSEFTTALDEILNSFIFEGVQDATKLFLKSVVDPQKLQDFKITQVERNFKVKLKLKNECTKKFEGKVFFIPKDLCLKIIMNPKTGVIDYGDRYVYDGYDGKGNIVTKGISLGWKKGKSPTTQRLDDDRKEAIKSVVFESHIFESQPLRRQLTLWCKDKSNGTSGSYSTDFKDVEMESIHSNAKK